MQNTTFLVLLRTIFAPKMKIAPIPMGLASRSCEGLAVIWSRKVKFYFWTSLKVGQENWVNLGEDLFFFWKHLISVGKTVSILVKIFLFYFSEIIWFWQKNCLNLIQEWWKFGSSSFTVASSFQKSPPPPLRISGYAPEKDQCMQKPNDSPKLTKTVKK